MQIDIPELCALARQGGQIAQGLFRRATARRKADHSYVTEADEQVEQLLVEQLRQRYPTIGIIGEESARHNTSNEYIWAIDPIDGTASFVAGLPVWGISIGLLHHGIPLLGVFYMPISDELYWNESATQAFFNGEPIRVREANAWDSQDWITVPSNSHRRYQIDFPGKARSMGSSVADLCYVARGGSVAALLSRCAIWDLAAGLAIAYAAGADSISLSGQHPDLPQMAQTGSTLLEPLIIANPEQLDQIRQIIRQR